ncbi:unnamed protein product [Closterium sp. NIES-54]
MEAPLQTRHMDVWGPARVRGQGYERYFLLVVDDYSLYTTVFPLHRKGEVTELSSATCLQTSCPPCAVPCVFLGFPPDAPGWQFYHPTSRRVLSSQDATFDESVPYYRLFPYRTTPLPPPPLFLAPGPPSVDPLPPQGLAPSGVSQVDAVELVEVAAESGAASGVEPAGAEPKGAEPARVESGGAAPGGPSGASSRWEPFSPQELREWFSRRWSRVAGAGGATGAGGSTAAGAAGGSGVTGPRGARTGGTGAAGPGGATGAGVAGGAGASGTAGVGAAVDTGAGATGATKASGGSAGAGGAAGASALGGAGVGATGAAGGAARAGGVGSDTGGAGAAPAGSGGAVRPRPYFVPLLEQATSPHPAPSPYTGPTGGLTERREPESRPASPVCAARTSRRGSRQRPPPIPGTHQMALRPSTAPQRVPLPSPPASSLPALADPPSHLARAASPTVTRLLATVVTNPLFESTATSVLVAELVEFPAHCQLDYASSLVAESESVCPPSVVGECALSTDILEDRQDEFQCFAAALPHLVSMLLAPEGDPDAPDIPTPHSYAEAIEGPYSS